MSIERSRGIERSWSIMSIRSRSIERSWSNGPDARIFPARIDAHASPEGILDGAMQHRPSQEEEQQASPQTL
eukprot:3690686-Lingulodinium_polyedra.AAC.1